MYVCYFLCVRLIIQQSRRRNYSWSTRSIAIRRLSQLDYSGNVIHTHTHTHTHTHIYIHTHNTHNTHTTHTHTS